MSAEDYCAVIERELGALIRHGERMPLLGPDGGETVLDRTSYAALRHLCDVGTLRLTALAETLGLDVSTVSRQVAALEAAGLVERSPDPHDRRACLIGPSSAGRHSLESARAARRAALRRLLHDWPVRDRAELARLLTRLTDDIARRSARRSCPSATARPARQPVESSR